MAVARYTRTAMALHWIIAALIALNVFLALTWDFYPDAGVRPAINTHKSIGITVLGLAIMRLLWRFTHRPPALPVHHKKWERFSGNPILINGPAGSPDAHFASDPCVLRNGSE